MALLAENFITQNLIGCFKIVDLRMPPTKIGQVDPEPRLSVARPMAQGLPRMKERVREQ